jgi:hypothetical protein
MSYNIKSVMTSRIVDIGINGKCETLSQVKISDSNLFEEVASLGISEKLQALS